MKSHAFSRNFQIMLVGQIITLFGSAILRFALSLYILDLTGSAEIFATLLAVSTIPTIFLSPIGGAIADRMNRRNLMVYFDFINGIVVSVLAVFLYSGQSSIVLIGVVMTVLSIVSTFYHPTVQASIPVLVENDHLLKANGLVSGVTALTNFAGPVIGGLLYAVSGINAIVVVTCVSFFLSAIILLFLHIPYEKGAKTAGAIKAILLDLKEGLAYVGKGNPFLLKIIIIAAAMNLFITPLFLVGIPYMIKIVMGMKDSYFGFTQGGISLSMIIAAVAISALSSKLRVNNLYLWFVGSGLFIVPMAVTIHPQLVVPGQAGIIPYLLFSLCTMVVMFIITIINIFIMTMLQKETPNHLLGKVMAILTAISTCAVPIGQILFGSLIEWLANAVYAVVVGVAVITILIALVTKYLLRGHLNQSEEQAASSSSSREALEAASTE